MLTLEISRLLVNLVLIDGTFVCLGPKFTLIDLFLEAWLVYKVCFYVFMLGRNTLLFVNEFSSFLWMTDKIRRHIVSRRLSHREISLGKT